MSSVSHELRTPLTSIAGYVELLLEEETDEEQRGHLAIVERNANRLLGLVSDLLFTARLAGRPARARASEPSTCGALVAAGRRVRRAARASAQGSSLHLDARDAVPRDPTGERGAARPARSTTSSRTRSSSRRAAGASSSALAARDERRLPRGRRTRASGSPRRSASGSSSASSARSPRSSARSRERASGSTSRRRSSRRTAAGSVFDSGGRRGTTFVVELPAAA